MPLENPQTTLFSDALESAYQIKVGEFEGPLDLLLHLIKKNEVDIYNIPIAEITRQYLDYLEILKELNLDIAGEFLVMAATLIQIKSRMLLPLTQEEEEGGAVEDPRAELVRRLLEYQRYREAGQELAGRHLLGRDTFARKFPSPELADIEPLEEVAEVEIFELVEAFRRVLSKVSVPAYHEVEADGISIAERISQVLAILHGGDGMSFESLFPDGATRELLVVTFLSILELCKMKMIKVVQAESLGSIWISCREQEAVTEEPLWQDP
ncbi:segregation/condensation protein A [Geomonas sp. RF6]|uniref:segregation and condensation protein A n=1 Tax=Geomonas sp. RF6 TaxID=2897342 RepID=UPI001E43FEBD|nr:segregation/condensation protein A [Geomonas sp. RF6]UFS69851.1 segregation/condensation protein A [Geomonas sp. RF6]